MFALHLSLETVVCPQEAEGGILWPRTVEGEVAEVPCTEAGPFYRAGPLATRQCNNLGEWDRADFSSCTLADTASEPFLLLWLVVEADGISEEEGTALEEEVWQSVETYVLLPTLFPSFC